MDHYLENIDGILQEMKKEHPPGGTQLLIFEISIFY